MRARHDMPPAAPPFGLPGGLGFRELRYFHSVARTGNFGRAARELNIGQPNVSHQVQKLEQELGTQLLIRHGRGVTLTQAGSRLMARIDAIMGLLNAPLDQSADQTAPGTLTLALPPEMAPLLAPRLLASCRSLFPGLSLTIQEGNSASLEEAVLEGRVDLAVLQDPPALPGVSTEPVVTERLGLVSGVRSGTAGDTGPVRMRQLSGVPLILPSTRHWIRRVAEDAAFRRGVTFGPVTQADSVPLIKEMVRNGIGLAILPLAAVRDEVNRGSLTFRAIDHDPLVIVHAIASREGTPLAAADSGVRRLLHDTMISLVTSGEWSGADMTAPQRVPEGATR